MYFALKPDCYFRRYDAIGYISRPIIGIEEVVDENGAIFLERLEYQPKNIDDIVRELVEYFPDINIAELKKDAFSFYMDLRNDSFINASNTLQDFKNDGFDYSTLKGRLAYKHIHSRTEESSAIFLEEYSKKTPFLQTFHIELTSKCNERCIHCYIPHEKKDTDIEYDLMLKALNQCKSMGVMTVIFSGGEPMLHPDFCDFFKYAKDLDFNVTVLTNLTMLNEEIITALKYKHVACVNVSLYSMDPVIHDSITTVKGSFERTRNNILKLIENNIAVQINCPIMKQNRDSFYDVINWGQDHKCSVVTDYVIMAKSDRTTENLNNRLSNEELEYVIEKIADNSTVFQSNVRAEKIYGLNDENLASPESRVCGVGLSTLCMIATGEIYPCAGWQQYVCGNLNDTTLEKIWMESSAVTYLRGLRLKDFKQCVGCKDYKYCLMCMSRNYNESKKGSIFEIPEITCDAAHAHHKIIEKLKKSM